MTTTFDDRLREELSAEDEAFLKDLEEDRGLFTQMGATLSGPMKYWTMFVMVFIFLFTAVLAYCGYVIWTAEDINVVVFAAVCFVGANLGIAMLKLWIWMRMNHLATLRELKLLELRLVRLTESA